MNVKRFIARTSRDALVLVRQALGEDAVVLSTKPSVDGVEVLAMAPDGMQQIERMAAQTPATSAAPRQQTARSAPDSSPRSAPQTSSRNAPRAEPSTAPAVADVAEDVAQLSMSTLSFQDYVRDRMLRRRHEAMNPAPADDDRAPLPGLERGSVLEQRMSAPASAPLRREPALREPAALHQPSTPRESMCEPQPMAQGDAPALLADTRQDTHQAALANRDEARRDQQDMMAELRSMKGLIEERFGALAFMEKLNRQPSQARLTQRLLECGFSPALIRKIGDSLPMDVSDETRWAAGVLERNLLTAEAEAPLEDQGGVYALVGPTGVGKTTTTAKIAAAFAAKYGAANLGLVTLDAYRIGAHEQLRAYGRILGVPVHTAHDRASLEDLLELLSAKKMVLIDTAGMAQRDARTRELLDMLSHRAIRKLLVVNAAAQGETIEDVLIAYKASTGAGIVLSKMDEAVKLAPALDALIRLKLKVVGVANGQRVPEDWHRLSGNALVHRALRAGGSSAYKLDASEVSLIFTAPIASTAPTAAASSPRAAARPSLNA